MKSKYKSVEVVLGHLTVLQKSSYISPVNHTSFWPAVESQQLHSTDGSPTDYMPDVPDFFYFVFSIKGHLKSISVPEWAGAHDWIGQSEEGHGRQCICSHDQVSDSCQEQGWNSEQLT